MKIKESELKILLIALGVMAAIASHMLVRQPTEEAILILETEIAAATTEKARLKEIEAQLDVILLETEENQKIVEYELMKYPEDVLVESFFMYADGLENNLEFVLNGVNVTVPSMIQKMDITRKVEEADVPMTVAGYLTTLSFGTDVTYSQLKSFIEYVHSESYRTVLNNISIAYNAGTGQLTISTIVYKYFITTPSYVYEPTDIPMIPTGNDNPFGTLTGGQAVPER